MFPYRRGLEDALRTVWISLSESARQESYPPLVFIKSWTSGFLLQLTAPASAVIGNKISGWAIRKFSGDWYEKDRSSVSLTSLSASRSSVISGETILTISPIDGKTYQWIDSRTKKSIE
jgi:hypothetical protein